MSYIQNVAEHEATGELAALYRRLAYPDGSVDKAFKALSLNPALLAADAALYQETMYGSSPLSRADRELLAVIVSRVNACERCTAHHGAQLDRLLSPADRKRLAPVLADGNPSGLPQRDRLMIRFAQKLSRAPSSICGTDIEALREGGFSDRAILDLCNLVS
ncbi:MAG TPA: peroxidase-related enzyme [Wenzhouxiangella sp.]|nr:peroxidase-related enzyme [Wenzhouxiangella sp.]